MDVKEFLELYAAGERDFIGVDLSEASLRGEDLGGANLSNANLTEACLLCANLSNANLSNQL